MKPALNPLDRALLSRQVCLGLCPLSRTNIGRPDCADLALDATLVTANVDHLLRVPGLRVEEFSCRESLPIQGDLGVHHGDSEACRLLASTLRSAQYARMRSANPLDARSRPAHSEPRR